MYNYRDIIVIERRHYCLGLSFKATGYTTHTMGGLHTTKYTNNGYMSYMLSSTTQDDVTSPQRLPVNFPVVGWETRGANA